MMIIVDTPQAIDEKMAEDPVSPKYAEALNDDALWNGGFPAGFFIIRSVASGKLLDVEADSRANGTEVILYSQMESSLIEGLRKPEADNQVFFIDNTGALCSRASGHAIDEENGRLVLRHRRPVTHPYPNAYSHPLPRFTYSNVTGEITISFETHGGTSARERKPSSDTSAISPQSSPQQTRNKMNLKYVLVSVPLRKPQSRTLVDNAVDIFSSAVNVVNPFSFIEKLGSPTLGMFPNSASSSSALDRAGSSVRLPSSPTFTNALRSPMPAPEDVHSSDLDLREDEVLEEDRGEGEELDDSPEPIRRVRVLPVRTNDVDGDYLDSPTTRVRRRWQVIPLRWSKASWSK